MMNLNMLHWREQLIGNNKRFSLPIMTHPGIELTGHSVMEAVTNGKIHYEAIKAVADHFPSIAATMIMDLTVEAEAFGSPVNFSENEVPSVTARIVDSFTSVEKIKIPELSACRLPQYVESAALASKYITNKPVFAGCIGPFSLAGRLFDMTEIMTAAFLEPDTITALLEKCSSFLTAYIEALKKTGVNGIIMAEPAAGLLDEALCETFSSVYIKKMVQLFQDDHFLFVLHNCGNTGHLSQSMASTGAHALHFGNRINLIRVLQQLPADIIIMGNIDPVGVFKLSSPEQIKKLVMTLLHDTAQFPNFVLSSGCDIPPGVPMENIAAFYEALAEFNNK
jgi:uroporphyrinogen decarboxylase